MPVDIVLVLTILVGTIFVLALGLLRTDLAALLAMVLVAVLGLVPYRDALAGFASPAVLAMAGMFVISAGLARTGVAELIGRWVIRWAGSGELRLMTVITAVSGVLSGFINNVGVAAMMLPVVVTVARRTSLPPSRLLIPMVLGAQLGGFTTLVGTGTNFLASDALREAGFEPFGIFSYTPVGLTLLGAGTLLVALGGPALLPARTPEAGRGGPVRAGIRGAVNLSERLFSLQVPERSLLDGRTLAESLIGSALGVHVLALDRSGHTYRAPGPETILRAGDRILVEGRPDYFLELRGRRHIAQDEAPIDPSWLESAKVGLARAHVAPESSWIGHTAVQLDLAAKRGVLLLSLVRGEELRLRTHVVDTPLREGDQLLLHGPRDLLAELGKGPELREVELLLSQDAVRDFDLADRLWGLRVTDDSLLEGRALGETRLGDAVGFLVLAIAREELGSDPEVLHLPGPDMTLRRGDHLLVKTRPEDLAVLRGLQRLRIDRESQVDATVLDGGDAGFVEVVLAPRSSLVGKTLRQLNFRDRFGLHVVGVVREGRAVKTDLRDERLRFGDALLLYGSRRHQRALAREPDLILLHSPQVDAPDFRLAPLSLFVAAVALLPVIAGLIPVAVGILGGALLMVLTRCLDPDEAYRAIDWPTLVLVAGMLALGEALERTGAVSVLGSALLDAFSGFGAHAVLGVLVVMAALLGQVVPGFALVVLMAPIAITASEVLDASPYPLVMAVGIAATSVASPVSQPAHALVMGPAGYRMHDYLRLGVPVTLLVIVLTVVVTPLVFSF